MSQAAPKPRGLARTAYRRYRTLQNRVIDGLLNVHTEAFDGSAVGGGQFADGVSYQAVDYAALWKLMKPLPVGAGDVVFDVGCGMGRVFCLFARTGASRCVGIELIPELAEVARRNAAMLRGRRAEVEVRTADACQTDYDGATVVFMFNPFGAETMKAMITRLRASVEASPRVVRIGYLNPIHEKALETSGWLRCFDRRHWPFSKSQASYWTNEGMA